jgi:hypothetical protein
MPGVVVFGTPGGLMPGLLVMPRPVVVVVPTGGTVPVPGAMPIIPAPAAAPALALAPCANADVFAPIKEIAMSAERYSRGRM